MITQKKLEILKKYHGDIDAWARAGTMEEKALMRDRAWSNDKYDNI